MRSGSHDAAAPVPAFRLRRAMRRSVNVALRPGSRAINVRARRAWHADAESTAGWDSTSERLSTSARWLPQGCSPPPQRLDQACKRGDVPTQRVCGTLRSAAGRSSRRPHTRIAVTSATSRPKRKRPRQDPRRSGRANESAAADADGERIHGKSQRPQLVAPQIHAKRPDAGVFSRRRSATTNV